MEYAAKNLDWNASAGQRLDELARALPQRPRLELTVFGSAPLQLLVERTFLSEDIDISPPEEAYDLLTSLVAEKGWAKGQSDFYIQVCDHLAFRTTKDWMSRAVQAERQGHLFIFPHPWDILVSKLQRLDPKDIQAFKLVMERTGHPTEEEFGAHLQKAVDLYRPKFDEETARGDMMMNTRLLWQTLWNKEIDVRAAIIRPALARSRHDDGDPTLKTRLANLKLPGER
ncbi:MAG: hypothetical protein HY298_17190 [Verrucomicrobia bacterium]|nr:hypothetical protein [Verrucomicrobiota bacterium]